MSVGIIKTSRTNYRLQSQEQRIPGNYVASLVLSISPITKKYTNKTKNEEENEKQVHVSFFKKSKYK